MPPARIGFPLSYQPLWLPGEVIASGPWDVISTSRLGAAASSVSFASIPAAYTVFRLILNPIKGSASSAIWLRFNNDSGANYSGQKVQADGTNLTSARNTGEDRLYITRESMYINLAFGADVFIAKTLAAKEALVVSIVSGNDGTPLFSVGTVGGVWNNTAALINRIDVGTDSGTFLTDSLFVLEGSR